MSAQPPVRVLVTVDTEEDDWGSYAPRGASVENIQELPEFHRMVRELGAQPTYYINYPPLEDQRSRAVLQEIAFDGGEVATHCHPWNTPPLIAGARQESMMNRLPASLNARKINALTELSHEVFNSRPTSFRAGRWGFGVTVAHALVDLNYRVDSSISPFIDWSPIGGPDYSSAPHRPYRFHSSCPLRPATEGELLEIPTTIGFLRGDPSRSAQVRNRIEKSWLRHTKVLGLLDRAGILARRWLSPEQSTLDEMKALADACVQHGNRVLDMTLHSSTLLEGATPFVSNSDEKRVFMTRIQGFLIHCLDRGWTFSTAGSVESMWKRGDKDLG